MKVGEARQIARQWVQEEAVKIPGFIGATFSGSTNWRADHEDMPKTSDVDIMVWTEGSERKHIGIPADGVVMSASILPGARLAKDPEEVLADFRIACHFSLPNTIIADPTGHLAYLHHVVAQEYAQRKWVRKRCEHALDRVEREVLGGVMTSAILSDAIWDRVFELYYAVSVTAQILALADLRNPTVRKCLVVSHEILQAHNQLEIQEHLLGIMGVAHFDRATIDAHVRECASAYDRAVVVLKTPFFFSTDLLAPNAREHNLGAIEEIIAMGLPREAMFWVHNVYSAAQKAIQNDAPDEEKDRYLEKYLQAITQLGLKNDGDFEERHAMIKTLLPTVMETAAEIMDRNPRITN